jgi:hypothetical protein
VFVSIEKLLKQQLKAAARLAVTADERAFIAWWESQIESIANRAPSAPVPENEAARAA